MARALHILPLLSRLCVSSGPPSLSASSCRSASRGVTRTWTEPGRPSDGFGSRSRRLSDGAEELEDVEDKIQALVDHERKRQNTVKYHIMRRKMTPSGAPQRKLTWDAMEQIRYLKQEQPEEWTVERLAEGFSVTPDVIRRVLRSKFIPLPERREKQNAKVMSAAGLQALPSGAGARQDRLKLPGNNRTPAILPSGGTEGALLAVANRTQVVGGGGSASPPQGLLHVAAPPAQRSAGVSKDALTTTSTEDTMQALEEEEEEEEEEEDSWDGQVLTEQELEELMGTEKPSPVMQMGKDFFDTEGNFLYRI